MLHQLAQRLPRALGPLLLVLLRGYPRAVRAAEGGSIVVLPQRTRHCERCCKRATFGPTKRRNYFKHETFRPIRFLMAFAITRTPKPTDIVRDINAGLVNVQSFTSFVASLALRARRPELHSAASCLARRGERNRAESPSLSAGKLTCGAYPIASRLVTSFVVQFIHSSPRTRIHHSPAIIPECN